MKKLGLWLFSTRNPPPYLCRQRSLPVVHQPHSRQGRVSSWGGHVSITHQGVLSGSFFPFLVFHDDNSFLEMISSAASNFPPSVYSSPPDTASSAPALNLQLGSLNVNLGGATPGVYRTAGEGGAGVQADGLRDGMRNLFGKVKQGVDRIGLQ